MKSPAAFVTALSGWPGVALLTKVSIAPAIVVGWASDAPFATALTVPLIVPASERATTRLGTKLITTKMDSRLTNLHKKLARKPLLSPQTADLHKLANIKIDYTVNSRGFPKAQADSKLSSSKRKKTAQESRLYRINFGGQGRGRTADTRIFSPLLYQLSYLAAHASNLGVDANL